MTAETLNHHKAHTRPRSERRKRQVMLAARVNADEERRIREAAKARNISVATLIRTAVLGAAEQRG